MHIKPSGFTLPELIVVTMVIAILATIGSLAYTSQLSTSRDARRISEVTSISDSLQVLASKGTRLPIPSSPIQITTTSSIQSASSVSLVGYQGEFGNDLLRQIGFQNGGLDPKDGFPYVYYTTKNRRQSQIMAYMEEGSNVMAFDLFIPKTRAALSDYSTRFPKVFGKPLGIIIENTTKRSIQDVASIQGDGFFNILTTGASYTVMLTNTERLTGASTNLVDSLPNKTCKRIRDIGASNGDGTYKINPQGGAEIEVYCDMMRDGGGWTLVFKNDGDSDNGLLLNSRNTGNGYNTSYLLKNTFGLPLVSSTGSATLNDSLITSLYTEQYRIDSSDNGKLYAKFTPFTNYVATTNYSKSRGCTYDPSANYSLTTSSASQWTRGFSHQGGSGTGNEVIVDLYAGDALRRGGRSYSNACPGQNLVNADGLKIKVWVR